MGGPTAQGRKSRPRGLAASSPELERSDGPVSRPVRPDGLSEAADRSIVEITRRAVFQHVVRALFPRSVPFPPRGSRLLPGLRERNWSASSRWGSTFSIFRPSIRSARPTARARTMLLPPSPMRYRQSLGDRVKGRGDTSPMHPELGTMEDFRRLVRPRPARWGSKLPWTLPSSALRITPTWQEHPEWFRGTPGRQQFSTPKTRPRKYEDIYPFDFESKQWRELWEELKSIFVFWIEQGVRVFRVDNPHTKPLRFWEWLIWEIKQQYPDIILPVRGVHPPEGDVPLGQAGLSLSPTPISPGVTRAGS
jgi:hypothetical protein